MGTGFFNTSSPARFWAALQGLLLWGALVRKLAALFVMRAFPLTQIRFPH
jgi:hypothetical protein